MARRESSRQRSASAQRSKNAAQPAASLTTRSHSAPPVKRRSIVRKPARTPTFRTSTPPAATPKPSAPIKRVSVVRKPARGPARRPARRIVAAKRTAAAASVPSTPAQQRPAPSPDRAGAQGAPAHAPSAPTTSRAAVGEQPYTIPAGYGDNRIVLMVKDPWWLHAYWEIQPTVERSARSQLLPQEAVGLRSILRVYDVTDVQVPAQPPRPGDQGGLAGAFRSFEIPLSGLATSWYIQTNAPARSFIVDIGLLATTGRFILLARSNRVTAPRHGPSDVIDEVWRTTDEAFLALLGAVSGFGVGSSRSGSGHVVMQHGMAGAWSSANLYGLGKPPVVRGFFCRVDTDLVFHGATEPKASVLVQGEPVAVRKDGTFSLRLSLPEGTQAITIDVTSADGRKATTVTPVVSFNWSESSVREPAAPRPMFIQPPPGTTL